MKEPEGPPSLWELMDRAAKGTTYQYWSTGGLLRYRGLFAQVLAEAPAGDLEWQQYGEWQVASIDAELARRTAGN